MVTFRHFKIMKLIPAGLFTVGSSISYYLSQQSTDKYNIAAAEQRNYTTTLSETSAANESHWSNNVQQINNNIALLDSKNGMDLITNLGVGIAHISMSLVSPTIAFIPLVPYSLSTVITTYSESTRKAEYTALIKELWIPDCSAKMFKDKLIIASDIGASMTPKSYAKFISHLYKLEDATNYMQLFLLGMGVYKAYALGGAVVSVNGYDRSDEDNTRTEAPRGMPKNSASAGSTIARPIAIPASAGTAEAGPFGGGGDNNEGTGSISRISPPVILTTATDSIADPANTRGDGDSPPRSVDIPLVGQTAHVATAGMGINPTSQPVRGSFPYLRDIKVGSVAIAAYALVDNIYSVIDKAQEGINMLMNVLHSERNEAVYKYIEERETARKVIEIGILKQQFEICSAKNPEVNAQLINTYTTDACNDGDIIENLLMGKEGCTFIDPAI